MRVQDEFCLPELFEHQKNCLAFFTDNNGGMLQMDPGCGKTIASLAIVKRKGLKRILVLTPKSVMPHWVDEAKLIGHHAKIIKTANKIPKGDFLVATHQSLLNKKMLEFIRSEKWDAIIIDESHKLKNPKAATTKAMMSVSRYFPNRYLLTGTPATKDFLDLWSQFFVIDESLLGNKYFLYRGQHFYNATAGAPFPTWKIRGGEDVRILAKIKPRMFVARKEECLDLPPLIKQTLTVELDSRHRAMYDMFSREFFLEWGEDREMISINTASKLIRLMQFCNGIVTDQDKESVFVGSEKINVAGEQVESIVDSGGKVIVWNHWRPLAPHLMKVLPKGSLWLDAKLPQVQRDEIIKEFQNNSDCRVLLASQGASGTGLNLQAANYMLYVSKTHDLGLDIQSEARNWRSGSEIHSKITRLDVVAKETIDEDITRGLWQKKQIVEILKSL